MSTWPGGCGRPVLRRDVAEGDGRLALSDWRRIMAMGLPTISLWPTTTVSLPARSGQASFRSVTAASRAGGDDPAP